MYYASEVIQQQKSNESELCIMRRKLYNREAMNQNIVVVIVVVLPGCILWLSPKIKYKKNLKARIRQEQ